MAVHLLLVGEIEKRRHGHLGGARDGTLLLSIAHPEVKHSMGRFPLTGQVCGTTRPGPAVT
jgi:hypothetical protein